MKPLTQRPLREISPVFRAIHVRILIRTIKKAAEEMRKVRTVGIASALIGREVEVWYPEFPALQSIAEKAYHGVEDFMNTGADEKVILENALFSDEGEVNAQEETGT